MSNLRITEDGDYRITEGGDNRVLEGADIGQVTVSGPAGNGRVSTNTPGNVPDVSVSAPAASAVGYTSAVAAGAVGTVTLVVPTVQLTYGVDFAVGFPAGVIVAPVETDAGGGGYSLSPIGTVTVANPSAFPTAEVEVTVALLEVTSYEISAFGHGDSLASPDIPYVNIVPPEDDAPAAGANTDGQLGTVGVSVPLGIGAITGEGGFDQITITGIEGSAGAFIYAGGDIGAVLISVPRVSTGKKIRVADALVRGLENYDAVRQIKKSS